MLEVFTAHARTNTAYVHIPRRKRLRRPWRRSASQMFVRSIVGCSIYDDYDQALSTSYVPVLMRLHLINLALRELGADVFAPFLRCDGNIVQSTVSVYSGELSTVYRERTGLPRSRRRRPFHQDKSIRTYSTGSFAISWSQRYDETQTVGALHVFPDFNVTIPGRCYESP